MHHKTSQSQLASLYVSVAGRRVGAGNRTGSTSNLEAKSPAAILASGISRFDK